MVACAAAGSQDAQPPVGSSFMVTPLSTAAQQPQSAARVLISATDSQGQIINAYRDVTCGNTRCLLQRLLLRWQQIVAGLAGSGKTIRAVSHRLPHSPSSFFCASLNGTGAPQATIVLDMKQVLAPLNPTTGLITVGASMDLYTLANIYEAGNRTLVSLSWPFHNALTVGGVFSVGGHGSSLLTGGLLMDQVKCVKRPDFPGSATTVNQKMADLAEATTFPVWAAYVTKNLAA
ncbi:hypothetical protein OEZ85_003183 [Tetradesmus obliquus]|uniref:FAD-binding PCMH-type domain-containing protein n=1 Tax=Tetradesmus obliquus TaxID=3088 RepID=A0ABY8TZV6_TETOB|nr:hypothetical protein OEZ85_003183 [Tetradesmus obliquus]